MGSEMCIRDRFLTIPVLIINKKYFVVGFKALWNKAPNMDSLIALGSAASVVYSVFAIYSMAYAMGHGDLMTAHHYGMELYFESAAMILTLITVGKYMETRSKGKTSEAISKLMDLAPKTATVLRGGVEQEIPVEDVVTGDTIIVKPGQRIPVDGKSSKAFLLWMKALSPAKVSLWKNKWAIRSSVRQSTKAVISA